VPTGSKQLEWLQNTVKAAVAAQERIIVMSHVATKMESGNEDCTLWDGGKVLDILTNDGQGHVVAYLAGHDHMGGYAFDKGLI
jgi:manganese-dependent ADP-ribose/CDP-alcohol diphosphatase